MATDTRLDAVRFLAACAGYSPCEPSTSSSGHPQLSTSTAGTITGLGSIALFFADKQQAWLGSSPEARAQIDEWLTWSTTELSPLRDEKLFQLNDWLATRTYLVDNTLTLADLVVFGVVQPAAATFPTAQVLHFANLLRWADLIQNTVSASSVFQQQIQLNKPKFSPPAAPTPAPVKAAPAAAAPAAAAAAQGKKDDKAAPAAAKDAAAPAAAVKDAAPAGSKAAGKGKENQAGDGKAAAPAAPAEGKPVKGEGKGKKDGDAAKAAAPAASGGKKDDDEVRIDMLDIRVGQIVKVDKHPNADALYLEEIDVGEEKPRQVISGLVKFVPVEQMQNRRVLVVCNLKPAKMREVMSYGMVLCASNETHDQVEPVVVPEGVPLGERVQVAGFDQAALEEVNPKKKVLERLFPDMKTDANGVPVFKGVPFTTSKGALTSSIPNGWVK